jgi:hypothetical protein
LHIPAGDVTNKYNQYPSNILYIIHSERYNPPTAGHPGSLK